MPYRHPCIILQQYESAGPTSPNAWPPMDTHAQKTDHKNTSPTVTHNKRDKGQNTCRRWVEGRSGMRPAAKKHHQNSNARTGAAHKAPTYHMLQAPQQRGQQPLTVAYNKGDAHSAVTNRHARKTARGSSHPLHTQHNTCTYKLKPARKCSAEPTQWPTTQHHQKQAPGKC
jgi:hypothetical protein